MSKLYEIINPYDQSVVGCYEFASEETIERKLNLLSQSRKQVASIAAYNKAKVLQNLSLLVQENKEEIAQIISKEMGKPIRESRVEVERSVTVALCSSHESRRIEGEILDCDAYSDNKGRKCHVHIKPIGTVLAITPFNFPFNLAMHKIAPAFAAGCNVLFKPGPQNYLSGKYLVDLCYQAGMPEEALQLCMIDIPQMQKVIEDSRIHCINFTGGVKAAQIIGSQAGYKKLIMELGGNDPLIVCPDANIEKAVETAIAQRFGTAGQRCNACKRVYVHEAIYKNFKSLLIEKSKILVIGNPLDEATQIGPVINSASAILIDERIQQAVSGGAKVLAGNKRVNNIIYPCILENLSEELPLVADETFGPVIPLFKYTDLDEVIEKINKSSLALQAGVFTNDLEVIKKLFDGLETGTLNVNDGPGFRVDHMPFGGVKSTGIGREGIRYAIREMSVLKNLVF
ncbi:MAG: aldehyde dehydrogenase family protein [Halobacteriovoraceae bacterium]|nr:aldehyde dehydrogenase family protein [Halobacteriovoraceae bacterium]MCB9095260.1 aldehyde dehydrogenase family protein [Halobacteriovoraceae bacterium]